MDEYTNLNGFKIISVYFNGYGILRYIEENYICIANKFIYNDDFGYICPCCGRKFTIDDLKNSSFGIINEKYQYYESRICI